MSTLPAKTVKPLSSAADPAALLTTSSSAQAAGPPSYPPTEVQKWLICPMFRHYSSVYRPRVEEWTPNRLVGSSIHAGIAAYLEAVRTGAASPASPALGIIACEVLRKGYVEQETYKLAGLEALVTKGTNALVRSVQTNLLPGATILGVEVVLKKNAPGPEPVPGQDHIADCILQRDETLEVWDWKSSLRLDDAYLPDRLLEAHHSWQLLDYAYHAQALFSRPVSRVGQGLIILGPKTKVEYSPVPVTQERLDQWRRDAEVIWELMRAQSGGDMILSLWHNWAACSDKHLHFGKRCQFFEACHTFMGNEGLFSALYRKVE